MKQSQLLTKTRKEISQQEQSINAQLLERAGYIDKLMAGVFTYLPLGYRVLTRIEAIVRRHMDALGAQEILMPALQPKDPWVTTGRWDTVDVLYKIPVGDRELCLGPTHEEIITPLAVPYISSYKDLPRAVYQMQTKFRNEPRPKSGVLRGREFRMKDLYSFHGNEQDLDTYYEKVKASYIAIFEECGLGDITYFTYASGGTFSKYSHEFQTITPSGEDTVFVCRPCKIALNKEIASESPSCVTCGSHSLEEQKAIEVGNIFKLNYKFSQPFNLVYRDNQDTEQAIPMGCYGLGTTRLMGTIVEALHDDKGILWPVSVAPFGIHLLVLSQQEATLTKSQELYQHLMSLGYDVLYDERDVRPGQKFADSDLMGIPVRLVISDKTVEQQKIECKMRVSQEVTMMTYETLYGFLKEVLAGRS